MIRRALIFTVPLLLAAPVLGQVTIHVPKDRTTIQAGIHAANNGDTVLVAAGTYRGTGNVNLDFGGKSIIVRSASGDPTTCTVDCQGASNTRGFTFQRGESASAVLLGFTVKNGVAIGGGGIRIDGASPTILDCVLDGNRGGSPGGGGMWISGNPTVERCVIKNNIGSFGGGGMFIAGGNPIIRACSFLDNRAQGFFLAAGFGGGVACSTSAGHPRFESCLFVGNEATHSESFGGAIHNRATLTVLGCTILNNKAENVGGIATSTRAVVNVMNSIVRNNSGAELGPDFKVTPPVLLVSYSNIEGGFRGTGNIAADPLFTNAGNRDYTLRANSPCIDRGDRSYRSASLDLGGHPRVLDGRLTRAEIVDMGAHEFSNVSLTSRLQARVLSVKAETQPSLDAYLLLGLKKSALPVPGYGVLLIDLGSPWILLDSGRGSRNVTLNLPPLTNVELHSQALVVDARTGAGNLSNLASVRVD